MFVTFSDDYEDGGALYYEINKASGWSLKNNVTECKQLNGFVPIDLYDPEIIIPSGDIFRPNPRIDEANEQIIIDYKIYDWPFFGNVDVLAEYSLDGQAWNAITTQKNISTGNIATDPSGIVGVDNQLVWNYTQGQNKLSKNVYYPNIQIRMRAVD
jgi:hypothetical protein